MSYPKPGSLISITVLGKSREVTVGGYNYGLGGQETSFYPEFYPSLVYPIEFMNGAELITPVLDEAERLDTD